MSPPTTVSVFILSYNRPAFLREAVRSVLAQQRRPDRIVVLDNGSGPEVKTAIAEELAQGVEWIGADRNHPAFWNHHRVLELATGDFFFLMHDDDRMLPHLIETSARYLEQNGDVVAVGCNGFLIDEDGKRMGGSIHRNKGGVIVYHNQAEMALLYSHSFIPFPSVLYRNGIQGKVDLQEQYRKVGDAIWLCDVASVGSVAFIQEELFEYRTHKKQDSAWLPEDQYRVKDEYLIKAAESDPRLHRKVLRNVAYRQTQRFMERGMSLLLSGGSIRIIVRTLSEGRPKRFSLVSFYINLIDVRRNGKRLVRKLRRA